MHWVREGSPAAVRFANGGPFPPDPEGIQRRPDNPVGDFAPGNLGSVLDLPSRPL